MCWACFILSGELWLSSKERASAKVFLKSRPLVTLHLEPGKVQPGFGFTGLLQLQQVQVFVLDGKPTFFITVDTEAKNLLTRQMAKEILARTRSLNYPTFAI